MSIPRSVVDEVRARTDIVELIGRTVTLRRKGNSWSGLCPFHQEKSPSFNVVPHKGIYHCFGCGESGDVFRFLMKTRGLNFVEAVKELAGPAGVVVEERPLSPEEQARVGRRADLYETVDVACRFFEATLWTRPEGARGRAYLQERGVDPEVARRYRLGYAPDGWQNLADHLARQRIPVELAFGAGLVKRSEKTGRAYDVFRDRILFPILDDRGRVVAFGGRVLPGGDAKDAPKYLNSPESEIYKKSQLLYGLSWARNAIQRRDRVIVVEGYFDALSLWQAGFEEAVAPCGTALTADQLGVLAKLTRKVVALFDNDEAGHAAAARALDLFVDAEMEASRLDLPGAKDPDEYLQKRGAAAFEERLGHAEPLFDLVLRRGIEREGRGPEAMARAVARVAPMLRKLDGLRREATLARVAPWLGVGVAELEAAVGAGKAAPAPVQAAPTRWRPSPELANLLWLLLHAPEEVGPVIEAEADPATLSDRPTVLRVVAGLLAGRSLPALLDEAQDPDLSRVLTTLAAREDAALLPRAAPSARQILARLELRRVDEAIAQAQRDFDRCQTTGDKSRYPVLSKQLAELYQRKTHLSRRMTRRDEPA